MISMPVPVKVPIAEPALMVDTPEQEVLVCSRRSEYVDDKFPIVD